MGTRYLETGEKVLAKQKIKGAKKLNQERIYNLPAQEPNSRFLRLFALEVYLYQWGKANYDSSKYVRKMNKIRSKYERKVSKAKKESKKTRLISNRDKKISKWNRKLKDGNWRMRQGRPLAVYDSSLQLLTIRKFEKYLSGQGYFDNQATVSTKKSTKKVKSTFKLARNARYFYDSIVYNVDDRKIRDLLIENKSETVKKGDAYTEKSISDERDRIHSMMLNNGYFYFSKQYVFFEVDTFSLDKPEVLLRINVASPGEDLRHVQYEIDSVAFIGQSNAREELNDSTEYAGVTYLFGKNKYRKDLLSSRLFLDKGELFSLDNATQTQRQLGYLDAFKFVNINYDTTGGKFVASIFTDPVDKYQTSNEIGLTSTAGLPGPFLNISLKNRNTLKQLELLELSGNLNLQGIDNISGDERNYSLLQYGGIASVTFPQFLFPLSANLKKRVSRYNPRTQISFSYNFEDRFGEYERQIFNSTFSYQWQIRNNFNYSITPLGLSLVESQIEPNSPFQTFLNDLIENGNGSYPASFESALLTVSSFDAIINNNYGNRIGNTSFLRLFFESGGNMLNFLNQNIFNFDNVRYQYVKFQIDHRRQIYIDRKTVFAARINFGLALPYGTDPVALPYEKYFYIGGSNSIRAWPARRLGPGDFSVFNDETSGVREIDYTLEQGGDMIIESSFELRRKITDFLSWAYFIDAGNIWQIQSTPLTPNDKLNSGKSGLFQIDAFPRELAVGTGLGLRIDFGYLVLRVDGAAQVFDPGQPGGSRFVFDNLDFFSAFQRVRNPESAEGIDLQNRKEFLRNKTRMNIGIGFPF